MFAELLGRSCFSFLQGASHPEELVERAQELGLSALGLCDRDGLYGVVRGWNRARALGLPFLVGAELRLRSKGSGDLEEEGTEPLSLALLAQTAAGYQNLCQLVTLSHQGQSKGEALCDLDWLPSRSEGLIALLPAPVDPSAVDPSSPEANTYEALLGILHESWGERAFVAAYAHLDGRDALRVRWAEQAAGRFGLDIIATSRPRYHVPARKPLADVLHCIR